MGMREELKIPLSMLSLSFLDKSKYKGSYQGKRFMFEKKQENETAKLVVYIWKDVFNFENTNKDDMTIKEFEYSKTGIEEGINFVEKIRL